MKQLNVNVTPEFDRDLRLLMKQRGITSKSEAIRRSVHEAAARAGAALKCDFRSLLGLGLKSPLNPNPRFESEDEFVGVDESSLLPVITLDRDFRRLDIPVILPRP